MARKDPRISAPSKGVYKGEGFMSCLKDITKKVLVTWQGVDKPIKFNAYNERSQVRLRVGENFPI